MSFEDEHGLGDKKGAKQKMRSMAKKVPGRALKKKAVTVKKPRNYGSRDWAYEMKFDEDGNRQH